MSVCSNRWAKREMGGTDFKLGGRTPLAPPLATALVKTGANPGGAIQAIAPPKTYELTLFTMSVYNSENSIPNTRPILSSIVLSQKCCEVYFISLKVVNPS